MNLCTQLGENQSLKKADEWRRLLTVTPVVLWSTWKDENDNIPDTEPPLSANEKISTKHCRKRKTLYDAVLSLCAAIRLLSTKKISMSQAKAGQTYLANYCRRLVLLGVDVTISHHLAMHFASMIKLFGPVYAWWLFAFERFNGMLERVKHNGHDGGRVELTMLRNWVQTHLIYDLLLALPPDASPEERDLIDRLIQTEAQYQRGAMMTEIAIYRSEAALNSISLPKRLSKPINLHKIKLPGAGANCPDLYTILFEHCRTVWPDLNLRRELSLSAGTSFIASQVARRLKYVRKDGIRYGSVSNTETKADTFALIEEGGLRAPVQIEELLAIQIPNSNHPAHICAVVRKLKSDLNIPRMPWDLL